jgi:hypothetical protein
MLNMVSPLARFGVCGGSAAAGTLAGSVKIQIAASTKIAPPAMMNTNVRNRDTSAPPARLRRDTRLKEAVQPL